MSGVPSSDLTIGQQTDPGRKRKDAPNQDAILVVPAENGRPLLLIVADGMGGYAGGAEASQVVIATIADRYRSAGNYDDLPALLNDCILRSHRALADYASSRPELSSMGSTVVMAAVQNDKVYVANVGDSRAYILRSAASSGEVPTMTMAPVKKSKVRKPGWLGRLLKGKRARSAVKEPLFTEVEIKQISYDHSVVADLVRSGAITPLQALRSPKKNRLTQSLSPRRKEITPYVGEFPFSDADTLLLCTDGLWGVIPEATLAAIALELYPDAAAKKLVEQAVSHGGPDNVSVIIARRGEVPSAVEDDTQPGL